MSKIKEFFKNVKEKKLTDNQKLYIRIGLGVLYIALLLFLVIRAYDPNPASGVPEFSRVAFRIKIFNFERDIALYALCIITGIFVAYIYGKYIAKRVGFNENNLIDGLIGGVLIGIIGARLWYVAFEWDAYKHDLLLIITGQGGLAIHGGIIFGSIFAYFFCKKRKEDILALGEMLFPGFFIGQIFGRWGNFFNKEAHGGPITSGRAFLDKLPIPKFVVDQMYINGKYMHPTFLYESTWNFIGLMLIILLRNKTKKYWYGDAIPFYLVWYGIGRYFIESIRTDALTFELFGTTFRTAQVTSILMIVIGLAFFIVRRIKKINPISYIDYVAQKKALKETSQGEAA